MNSATELRNIAAQNVAALTGTAPKAPAAQPPTQGLIQPDVNGEFPTPLDGALFMASLGVPQTPLKAGTKVAFLPEFQRTATTNPVQIRAWAAQYQGCNFGSLGREGEFFTFESDSTAVRDRFQSTGGQFTSKLMVMSRPGRGHRWYKHAPGVTNIQQSFTKHGDFSVRAKNMYCVSPGSVHPDTGQQYRLIASSTPEVPTAAEIAFWESERVEKNADGTTEVPRNERGLVPQGSIHGWMLSQAGKLRAMGLDADEIEPPLMALVHKNCEPPIDEEKVRTMAKSICNFPAGSSGLALTLGQQVDAAATTDSTFSSDKNMPDPLRVDAYHGLAGRHLRNIEANSEAHPAGILGIFLSGFGSIVGRQAFILVEDSVHFPAINVLVTGKSSRSRKDTATGRALRPLKEADNMWAKNSIHQSFASGEALTAYFHNMFNKLPLKPIRLFVTDTEFKTTMTICGRQGNTLSEGYRRLFNGDAMENIVKKSRLHAPYTCGSVSGAITLGELQETLKQVEIESGFVNRFLTMLIHRVRRISRPSRVTDETAIKERAAIVEELRKVISWVESHKATIHGMHAGEPLTGISMSWADDAGELWDAFYNGLGDDDAEYLNRAEVFVLRLTMIYALLDKSAVMRVEHVKAALAVWEYAKQSAALVYGSAQSPDVTRLLGKALASGKMTRGSVSNFFGRHKSAEELDWLMEEAVRLSKGQLGLVTGLDKWSKPTIAGIVNKSRQTQETGSGGGGSKAA